MDRRKGFSLIELLIVVAIILVIAAIAIPNMLRAKQSANEASAARSVRTISSAEITYAATYPEVGFTCTLSDLGPYTTLPSTTAAGLIDNVLSNGAKSGYSFALSACTGTPATNVFVSGTPKPGAGIRNFCSDQSGVLRYESATTTCTTTSSPLQ